MKSLLKYVYYGHMVTYTGIKQTFVSSKLLERSLKRPATRL